MRGGEKVVERSRGYYEYRYGGGYIYIVLIRSKLATLALLRGGAVSIG